MMFIKVSGALQYLQYGVISSVPCRCRSSSVINKCIGLFWAPDWSSGCANVCLSDGAHFPCLMEVGAKQHAMCLHFTHHEVWMTDSKVSLHCNGHGQIDGAWLSENCHFHKM